MNLLIFNLKTDADDSVLGFTTDWINALAEKCERVVVVTMTAGRIVVARNVAVYSVGRERGYSEPRRLLEFYRVLLRLLRSEQFDACFAHMMPLFAVLGWPLLRWKRIPIVLWYAHSHVSFLLRLATILVHRVVASSPSGFQIPTTKLRTIGQGIDITRFAPPPQKEKSNGKTVLLTVGRIAPVKRLEVTLQAFAMLPPEIQKRLELRYVGEPLQGNGKRYAALLQDQATALGLNDSVRFCPALPFHKVQEAYQAADIFINCSDTDSMDKAILEAMSCGLPIVTSNAAYRSVLGEELSANWVVPKGDVKALSDKLLALLTMDSRARKALGNSLRDIVVREHSLPALRDRLLQELRISSDAH